MADLPPMPIADPAAADPSRSGNPGQQRQNGQNTAQSSSTSAPPPKRRHNRKAKAQGLNQTTANPSAVGAVPSPTNKQHARKPYASGQNSKWNADQMRSQRFQSKLPKGLRKPAGVSRSPSIASAARLNNGTSTSQSKKGKERSTGIIQNGGSPTLGTSPSELSAQAIPQVPEVPSFDFASDFVQLEAFAMAQPVAGPSKKKQKVIDPMQPIVPVVEPPQEIYPEDETVVFLTTAGKPILGVNPFFSDDFEEFQTLLRRRWRLFDEKIQTIAIRFKPAQPAQSKGMLIDTPQGWLEVVRTHDVATAEKPLVLRLSRPPLVPAGKASQPSGKSERLESGSRILGAPSEVGAGVKVRNGSAEDKHLSVQKPTIIAAPVTMMDMLDPNGGTVSPSGEASSGISEIAASTVDANGPVKKVRGGKRKRQEAYAEALALAAAAAKAGTGTTRIVQTIVNGAGLNSNVENASETSSPPAKRLKTKIGPAVDRPASALADVERFRSSISSPLAVRMDDPMEGIESAAVVKGTTIDAEEAEAEARLQALSKQLEEARQLIIDIKRKKGEAERARLAEVERAQKAAEQTKRVAEEAARVVAATQAKTAENAAIKLEQERRKQLKLEAAEAAAREEGKARLEADAARLREAIRKEEAQWRQDAEDAAAAELSRKKAEEQTIAEAVARAVEAAAEQVKADAAKADVEARVVMAAATPDIVRRGSGKTTPEHLTDTTPTARPGKPTKNDSSSSLKAPAQKQTKEASVLAAWRAANPTAKVVIPSLLPPATPNPPSSQRRPIPSAKSKSSLGQSSNPVEDHQDGLMRVDSGASRAVSSNKVSRASDVNDVAGLSMNPTDIVMQDHLPEAALISSVLERRNSNPLMARLPSSEPESYTSDETEEDPHERLRGRGSSPGTDDLEPEGDDATEDIETGSPHRSRSATPESIRSPMSEGADDETHTIASGQEEASTATVAETIDREGEVSETSGTTAMHDSIAHQGSPGSPAALVSRASFAELDGPLPTQPTLSGTNAFFAAIDAEEREDAVMTGGPQLSSESTSSDSRAVEESLTGSALPRNPDEPGSPTPIGGQSRSLVPSSSVDENAMARPTPKAKQRMLLKDGSPATAPAGPVVKGSKTSSARGPTKIMMGEPSSSGEAATSTISKGRSSTLALHLFPTGDTQHASSHETYIPDSLDSGTGDVTATAPMKTAAAAGTAKAGAPAKAARAKGPLSAIQRSPCVLCDAVPSHLQKDCPVVIAGLSSIERRKAELQADTEDPHEQALEKLEGWINRLRNAKRSALMGSAPLSGTESGALDPGLGRSPSLHAPAFVDRDGPIAQTPKPLARGEPETEELVTETMLSAPVNGSLKGSIPSGANYAHSDDGPFAEWVTATEGQMAEPTAAAEITIATSVTTTPSLESDSDATVPEADVEMEDASATVHTTPTATQAVPLPSPALSQVPSLSYNPRSDIPSLSSLRPDILRKPRLSNASLHSVLVPATQPVGSVHGSSRLGSAHSASGSSSDSDGDSSDLDSDSEADANGGRPAKPALSAALAGRMAGVKAAAKAKKAKGVVQGW